MKSAGSPRAWFDRWLRQRSPRQPGPVALTRRRIYILPTRFGLGYAGLLIVMLLGAINYGNSMAYALTFLLAGIGLVVMHHTHGNLLNLHVSALADQPVFAGQAVLMRVELANPTRQARYALNVDVPGYATRHQAIDVSTRSSGHAELNLVMQQRGLAPLPRFRISSEFPLGLFHAWGWVEIDATALVYPRPAGHALARHTGHETGSSSVGKARGNDDFAGLREYHSGDPLRIIDWKSLARSNTIMVKQFSAFEDNSLWLDWNALPQLATEARLSQLCQWLLQAEREGRDYGLKLPSVICTPDHGGRHRRQCLRHLALFESATGKP